MLVLLAASVSFSPTRGLLLTTPRAPLLDAREQPKASLLTTASWVGGTVVAGALPAVFVVQNLEPWYADLKKPSWSPPNNVFAPVWTTLYALIGLACSRALGNPMTATRALLTSYGIQAVLNLSWAPVFFGEQWRSDPRLYPRNALPRPLNIAD
jgi:hypothetical protein